MAGGADRHGLGFDLSRRDFFRALFLEARDLSGVTRGQRSFALSDLAELPDDELARLIPMVQPVFAVYVEDEYILARHGETGNVVELCPSARENILALNLFNGQIGLGTAGRRLALQMEWDESRGYEHVKGLFLSLVGRLICVPRNSLEPEG